MQGPWYLYLILAGLAYLLGAIPTGVWYSKWVHGQDVRQLGSGNSGTTNIGRNFGFQAAVIVALGDVLKGLVPVLIARWVLPGDPLAFALTASGAVLGHSYPVFAGFQGGKIVATSIGILIAYHLPTALVMLLGFFTLLYLTSTVSLASLLSFGLATGYLVYRSSHWLVGLTWAGLYLLLVYRHRSNIHRLIQGQENKIKWGLNQDQAPKA